MARHSHCVRFLAVLVALVFWMDPVTVAAESKAVTQFNRMVLKRNFKKSAEVLQAAAKAGDPEAQYRLGNLYLAGLGLARDKVMARDLLQRSAAAGNLKAQRLLRRLDISPAVKTGTVTRPAKGNRESFAPPVKAADLDAAGNSWLTRAAARGQAKAIASLAGTASVSGLPLLTAAAAGQADVALLLIRAGAPIDTADSEGRTALMHAAASKSPVLAASLLEAGADAAKQDARGDVALHYAIRRCNVEAVTALLRNSEPPAVASPVSPYLHSALQYCAVPSLIGALLPHVDIDTVNATGRSALWEAANGGQTQAALQLIGKQAKVSLMDGDGLTPLHAAAGRCQVDVLSVLLQANADVNAATRDGDTPLMLAAGTCRQGVTLLIAARAVLDVQNIQGETALLVAVSAANAETVTRLLVAGADPTLRNNRRETAASIALRLGNADVMALLAAP